MKKSTVATAITAIAIAVVVPFVLAQMVSSPDAAPSAAAAHAYAAGPAVMGGYEADWMRNYSGLWALILLPLGFVGLAVWIVNQKPAERIESETVLQRRRTRGTQCERVDSVGEDHSAG